MRWSDNSKKRQDKLKIIWEIESKDVERIHKFYNDNWNNTFEYRIFIRIHKQI